jgi:hypothetical protein
VADPVEVLVLHRPREDEIAAGAWGVEQQVITPLRDAVCDGCFTGGPRRRRGGGLSVQGGRAAPLHVKCGLPQTEARIWSTC